MTEPQSSHPTSAQPAGCAEPEDVSTEALVGNIEISLETLGECGDFGALAHYADPAYYSLCYRSRTHDVEYYVQLARQIGGPVLEYGCGNGRITAALAQAGLEVWGVDFSRPMLNDLERRLAQLPPHVRNRVHLTHGDMRKVRLERPFALVLAPFNVMLHLYQRTDIEEFLGCVRSHLQPGAVFVGDVSIPQPADLARKPSKRYRAPSFRHPETHQVIDYAERFEYDPIRQLLLVWMEFTPKDGSEPWVIPLTHRQFFPCELEAYLHYAGFAELTFSADFTDQPLDAGSDSLVFTARCNA